MSVDATIPQIPSRSNVEIIVSPEDPQELWVIPSRELGCIDLPRLRHLLPADFATAEVWDFEPLPESFGAWILRRGV